MKPSEYLSQNEIAAATLVQAKEFNAQQQSKIVWPANAVVARAYLDQLTRTKGILPARVSELKSALERSDTLQTGRERNAAATLDQLDKLAAQLESDASSANARDAMRLRSLAATLKSRAARLR